MSDREQFEKWAKEIGFKSDWDIGVAKHAWQTRQPEIDALTESLSEAVDVGCRLTSERDALKAEVERLRRSERRILNELISVKDAHATVYQKINPGLTFNGAGTVEQAPANAALKETK